MPTELHREQPAKQPLSAERRTEPRESAVGEVHLRPSQNAGGPFVGRLLDIANTGFRACHQRFALGSGDLVDFEYGGRTGLARAMWTRIVGDHVETGFRICHENVWSSQRDLTQRAKYP
jgi:hypothetical protein